MAASKQAVAVPGITKAITGLAFVYLILNIACIIVVGAATATPLEGPARFKMYLSAGVIIALASGLYKMEKWAWWCCVLTSGLRAAMGPFAFFALFMAFRTQQVELTGLGAFGIGTVVVAFILLAAIFVLLLSRRARQAYRIGGYAPPKPVVQKEPELAITDLPSPTDVLRAYGHYETQVRQVNALPDADKLRYVRTFARQPEAVLEKNIGAGPAGYEPGAFGLMLFEMIRRKHARPEN